MKSKSKPPMPSAPILRLNLLESLRQLYCGLLEIDARLFDSRGQILDTLRASTRKRPSFSSGRELLSSIKKETGAGLSMGREKAVLKSPIRILGRLEGAIEIHLYCGTDQKTEGLQENSKAIENYLNQRVRLAELEELQNTLDQGANGNAKISFAELIRSREHLREMVDFQAEELNRARQKTLMLDLLQDVGTTSEIEFLIKICPNVSSFMAAQRTTLWLYEAKTNQLRTIYGEGLENQEIVLAPDKGLVGESFTHCKTFYSNNPYGTRGFHKRVDKNTGFRTVSNLVTPIIHRNKTIGVLQVLNKEGGFTDRDINKAVALGETLTAHMNIYKLVASHIAASEELKSLLETIPDLVYRLDRDGKIQYISKRVEDWGYLSSELIGNPFSSLISRIIVPQDSGIPDLIAEDSDGLLEQFFALNNEDDSELHSLEVEIPAGPHKPPSSGIDPVANPDYFSGEINASGYWTTAPGKTRAFCGTIGIVRDITSRKQAEVKLQSTQAELIRAERVAGLGTLAAGIAHDFNNLLGVIGVGADIILMAPETGLSQDAIDSTFRDIVEAVKKASDLTQRLLTVAKTTAPNVEITSLTTTIEDAVKIMSGQLESKGIQLSISLDESLPLCMLDQGQVRDMLINLITNGMHAIEELNLLGPEDGIFRRIGIETRKKGTEIELLVWDTGAGIPESILPGIYDPFFTTRDRGVSKGTGLGLSMVYTSMQNHGGRVNAQSYTRDAKRPPPFFPESFSGTLFSLYFPLVEGLQPIEELVPDSLEDLEDLNLKIFVVDDEATYRKLIRVTLETQGYSDIETFCNGTEVMEALEQAETLPRIIISDLQMPPLDGLELVQAAKKAEFNPSPIFIICSGKLTTDYIQMLNGLGVSKILAKPFRSRQLIETIHDCLKTSETLTMT
jgi:two-component system, cell cycle sensor histidine kinase and response regulator CckA